MVEWLLCAASVTLSPAVAPVHPHSAPRDSEQNTTSFNRNLYLYCHGLGFSVATLMVEVVGAQRDGQVPEITEHHNPVTHKKPPSAHSQRLSTYWH